MEVHGLIGEPSDHGEGVAEVCLTKPSLVKGFHPVQSGYSAPNIMRGTTSCQPHVY